MYASSSCIHNWWLSPYGTSKKVNEETAFDKQVGLRFTTVYGDGARESMLIGKLLDGSIGYLTRHVRDFIHVDDVVEAHMNNPAISARFLPYKERPEYLDQIKAHQVNFFGEGSE